MGISTDAIREEQVSMGQQGRNKPGNGNESIQGEKGNQLRGSLMLFGAAFIWGFAFVAQRIGMDHVGPFTFNAVRNLIGAAVLVPCIAIIKQVQKKQAGGNGNTQAPDLQEQDKHAAGTGSITENGAWLNADRKMLLQGGLVTGFFLCIASNLQQAGIKYTSVGKAGFITALYIVLVPLLGIFLKKRIGWKVWASVGLAIIGLYLLCMSEELTIGKGDILMLLCALAFAFQILSIDHYAQKTDVVMLACLEFLVCGLLTTVLMFLFEKPTVNAIIRAGIPILYAGVLSCGVAYTLQIIGQKDLPPTIASLIMSLESVISALAGWLILHQSLSVKELSGCVIMFAAIILAQLPSKEKQG